MTLEAANAFAEPVFRPVGDSAVLVEFGNRIDDSIHERVLQLDASLSQADPLGFVESIPAYTSLLVGYDPLVTDFETLVAELKNSLCSNAGLIEHQARVWEIPTCYGGDFAPDLVALSDTLNLSPESIIEAHTSARYKVYLYGFAPGYAYLGGTPARIQVPRKPSPVHNVPTGSVMIAGAQSLITTVQMPSGWWVIGRTTMTPLQPDQDRPFLFAVGDEVVFAAISEEEFQAQSAVRKGSL